MAYVSGDLGGSRTRVVGMKTRCTNRYTTRPSCKCLSYAHSLKRRQGPGVVAQTGIEPVTLGL